MQEPIIITLGQESASVEVLEGLIAKWGILQVLDVRARPARKALGFWEKRRLRSWLQSCGVGYHWLGDSLAKIPEWQHLADKRGIALPENLIPNEVFRPIAKLRWLLGANAVLILGTQENAYHCPRFYQISPIFQLWGCKVLHHSENGMVENWQLELELAADYLPMQAKRGFPSGLIFAYQSHRKKMEAKSEEEPPDIERHRFGVFQELKWNLRNIFWGMAGA